MYKKQELAVGQLEGVEQCEGLRGESHDEGGRGLVGEDSLKDWTVRADGLLEYSQHRVEWS